MQRRWLHVGVLCAVVGLFGGALYRSVPGASLEENDGLTWLFTVRGPIPPPEKVIVVAADRRSADALGIQGHPDHILNRWSRALHGQLIDRLVARGAAVIVFDILFTASRTLEEDSVFADAIARAGNVVLAEDRRRRVPEYARIDEIRMPIPRFAEMAAGTAPFVVPQTNAPVTQVWTFRPEVTLTPTLPVLALQTLAKTGQATWEQALREAGSPVIGLTSLKQVEAPERFNLRELTREYHAALSTDSALAERLAAILESQSTAGATDQATNVALLRRLLDVYRGPNSRYVNFYGPPGTVLTLPYASLLAQSPSTSLEARDLGGVTAFVGVSELEQVSNKDYVHTVFTGDGVRLSGVELAATTFANMRDGVFLKHPMIASALLVTVFGVGVCFIVCQLVGRIAVPAALAAGGAYATAVQLAFNYGNLWLPLAIPIVIQLPLALIAGVSYRYWLTRVTIEPFVDLPSGNDIVIKPIAYTGPATCLIADAEGYTSLVAALGAEAAREFMNDYYDAIARAVAPYSPDFDEFPADNALYGWFGDDTRCRERACLAAMAGVRAVTAFSAAHRAGSLGIRIGLAVGMVVHGTVGARKHLAYRLVGDPVNAAARAQALNKMFGSRVLATTSVVADLESVLFRRLGCFTLHGIEQPVPIAEILSEKAHADLATVRLAARFDTALALHEAGRWQEAQTNFASLVEDYPEDGASRYYLRKSAADAAE